MANLQQKRLTQLLKQSEKGASGKRSKFGAFTTNFNLVPHKRYGGVIYAVFRNLGQVERFSTGITCEPQNFDLKSQRTENDFNKNKLLDYIQSQANELYAQMILTDRDTSLKVIKNAILGTQSYVIPNVFELLDEYLADCGKRVGKTHAHRTYQRYRQSNEIIKSFVRHQYKTEKLRLSELKPIIARQLETYMMVEKGNQYSYYVKVGEYFRQVLHYALLNEYIDVNPLSLHKFTKRRKPIEYLTPDELIAIYKVSFIPETLQKVRDCFVFGALTGLAYQDLRDLSPQQIKTLNDGQKIIILDRGKTKNQQVAALRPDALEILHKYQFDPYCKAANVCLPVLSNQKFNTRLKELAKVAGIEKRVTTHYMRRTYATHLKRLGVSAEMISKSLGNTSVAITEHHYIDNDPETIVKALNEAFNRQQAI